MARLRLPSLAAAARSAWTASLRFPAVVVAAAATMAAGFMLVAPGGEEEGATRLLMAASLGMPLGVALTVTLERRGIAPVIPVLGATLLVAGGFWLGWAGWTETLALTRFAHLALLCHLLVACLPFLGRREPAAFWQFNRRILYRWLEGGVYAATLFLGLALALAALDNLFGVDVSERAYAYLWVTVTLGFHPLFFLAGVPREVGALERDETYPSGLRGFATYALVPLTVLYLAILTAYFVKVVATGQWPSGWIGWLVSGAATLGILTLLLASPPAARDRPVWVAQFERWFWPALLPAAIMVGLAIWKRIGQYGLTERRYFLAALTVWLGATALAFTLRRARALIVIPASLAAVALATFAGPWGAYRVAERSQLQRLEALLGQLGMHRQGRITPAAGGLDPDPAREAANIATYLATTHGRHRLGPWLAQRGVTIPDRADSATRPRTARERATTFAPDVLLALGLVGYERPSLDRVWVNRGLGGVIEVKGWDYLVPLGGPTQRWAGADTLTAIVGDDRRRVVVRRGGPVLVEVDLGPTIDSLAAWRLRGDPTRATPDSLLEAIGEGPAAAVLVRLRHAALRDSAGVWRAYELQGDVLVRLLEPSASPRPR